MGEEEIFGGPCIYCGHPDGSCGCVPNTPPKEGNKEGSANLDPDNEFMYQDGPPLVEEKTVDPKDELRKMAVEDLDPDTKRELLTGKAREKENESWDINLVMDLLRKGIGKVTEENRIMENALKVVASGKQEDAPQFVRGILEHIQALRSV